MHLCSLSRRYSSDTRTFLPTLHTSGSVDAQVAYGSVNSKWVANRTYGFEVHNSDSSIRLRFGAINTNSFVTKYGKANYKYNTSEFRAYVSPTNSAYQ